jgi:hypothetical protein
LYTFNTREEGTLEQDASSCDEKQSLSRRELLKLLVAASGAVAASSLLPNEWVKPRLGLGVLPAHAQSTVFNELRCEVYNAEKQTPIQRDLIFPGNYNLYSCATVIPSRARVPLKCVVEINYQTCTTFDVSTDESGVACTPDFNITLVTGGLFVVTWFFRPPEDGPVCSHAYDVFEPPYPPPAFSALK